MTEVHATVYATLAAWVRLEHAGARRRQGVSFRAAADMRELWQWVLAGGLVS